MIASTLFSEAELPEAQSLQPLPLAGAAPFSGASSLPTLFVKQNLRSGQSIHYEGNVVIIGHAHAGSEICAAGDINVWGELRGIAHAGLSFSGSQEDRGNLNAEIRALNIEALQLRIGDTFARRPDRMTSHKPGATWTGTPEVARVINGEIQIFSEVHEN